MPTEVQFFFSPASRYSYLASTQIADLEEKTGCVVNWRPVHGPDIRKLRGKNPFDGTATSGQYESGYRRSDAEAWAALYNIPFIEPQGDEFDYRIFVRAAAAGLLIGAGDVFLVALCHAVWGTGNWPIDRSTILTVAEQHRLPSREFVEALDSEKVNDVLATTAQEAYNSGAFGVPTFFIGEQMFWGNDRLPLVYHALNQNA